MKQAFSMIELLVVVAITGVLVSLLLVSLQLARGLAHQVRCSSNLHQIGVGLGCYQADNAGMVPPPSTPVAWSPTFEWCW